MVTFAWVNFAYLFEEFFGQNLFKTNNHKPAASFL